MNKISTQQGLVMAVKGLCFSEDRLHAFVTKHSVVRITPTVWEDVKKANGAKKTNIRA